MGLFGKSAQAQPRGKTPVGVASGREVQQAAEFMERFNNAVPAWDALQDVSAAIFGAAGIGSSHDLLRRPDDIDIAWRWLEAASSAAAECGDVMLPSRIFACASIWNAQIAPDLQGTGIAVLLLPEAPADIVTRLAATALPCLLGMPDGAVIFGNRTGNLTAHVVALLASDQITGHGGSSPAVTPRVAALARDVLAGRAKHPWPQAEAVRVLPETDVTRGRAETLPRLDGLYRADDRDFSRFLRFSSFNRVSHATTTRDANAEDVARWLGPEHALSDQGTYALSGHQISFTIFSSHGEIAYTGLLSSDGSAINLSLPFESVYTFTRTGTASAHSADAAVNRISHFLAQWEPAISALVAADYGDARAGAALDRYLSSWADSTDWAALANVLARIKAGDRYDPNLLTGLDKADRVIATRALDALAGKVTVSTVLGPAMKFGTLLSDLVFAAAYDDPKMAEFARRNLRITAHDSPDLAVALGRILDGDRNPDLASRFADPFERDVVKTVLHYIPLAEAEDPRKRWR